MRRLSNKEKARLRRRRRKITSSLTKDFRRKAQAERQKKKRLRKIEKSLHRNLPTTLAQAPETITVFGDSSFDLIELIKKIKNCAITKRKIIIDFTNTKKIVADGMLLLYAEVDRILDIIPSAKIKCKMPSDEKAAQVLQQIGFLKRIGVNSKLECGHDDVVTWRKARGQGAQGEKYDAILGHYDGIITEALQSQLYTGLTEAMTNAHQHAYLFQRGDKLHTPDEYKPWWMFSQEKDGKLTVVFCDLGVGIPRSLPRNKDDGWKKWWDTMVRLDRHRSGDAMLIRGAVRHSTTRTRKIYRGKGLRQIIQTVSADPGGRAIIQSNKGWYRISEGKETWGNHKRSIEGTVIYWQLPLTESAET